MRPPDREAVQGEMEVGCPPALEIKYPESPDPRHLSTQPFPPPLERGPVIDLLPVFAGKGERHEDRTQTLPARCEPVNLLPQVPPRRGRQARHAPALPARWHLVRVSRCIDSDGSGFRAVVNDIFFHSCVLAILATPLRYTQNAIRDPPPPPHLTSHSSLLGRGIGRIFRRSKPARRVTPLPCPCHYDAYDKPMREDTVVSALKELRTASIVSVLETVRTAF